MWTLCNGVKIECLITRLALFNEINALDHAFLYPNLTLVFNSLFVFHNHVPYQNCLQESLVSAFQLLQTQSLIIETMRQSLGGYTYPNS